VEEHKPLIDHFKKNIEWFDCPSDFNCMVMHPIKSSLRYLLQHDGIVKSIFMDYSFFEHQVRHIIEKHEGFTCCADKSRHLIRAFIDYKNGGDLKTFSRNEDAYWETKIGDYKEWFDFLDGCVSLRNRGDNSKYLVSYLKLVSLARGKEMPIIEDQEPEKG